MITAPNGDIFVSDGHSGQGEDPPPGATGRILKFDRDGNFIKEWGEIGFRPGQFRTPHALEFDSQGRLYVADRGNHRIQIFDQDGNLLEIYTQFSRNQRALHHRRRHAVCDRLRIDPHTPSRLEDRCPDRECGEDRLTGFVPPHAHETRMQGVAGEGVAVDADGNVYAAEGPGSRPTVGGGITKYVVAAN